jgi:hypothetical protein
LRIRHEFFGVNSSSGIGSVPTPDKIGFGSAGGAGFGFSPTGLMGSEKIKNRNA